MECDWGKASDGDGTFEGIDLNEEYERNWRYLRERGERFYVGSQINTLSRLAIVEVRDLALPGGMLKLVLCR